MKRSILSLLFILSSVCLIAQTTPPSHAVQPAPFGSVLIPYGESVEHAITLRNIGTEPVQSIHYTISTDGVEGEEQEIYLYDPIEDYNGSAQVNVTFISSEQERSETRRFTVTRVNGQPNSASVTSVQGPVASTTAVAKRRVTMEECTGTGCGWCPRGLVGMDKLHTRFGDDFIGLALHWFNSSDPMYLNRGNYANLNYPGAPSAMVDRSGNTDPYNNAENVIAYMLTIPAKVDIELEAHLNTDGTTIDAQATVSSLIDGADFGIEYVLVADGLYNSAWKQENYYSKDYASSTGLTQKSLPSDLAFLWNAGATYSPTFNDVVLSSSYTGYINRATPLQSLSSAQPAVNSFTLTIPQTMMRYVNMEQLRVVALVIDYDGTITNAAQAPVADSSETKVEDTPNQQEATTPVEIYDINGCRLNAARRGINITRTPTGTTRKLLLK